MTVAVRGAILVSENTRDRIWDAAGRLVAEMRARNGLREEEIVSILFSVTEDLTAGNPAEGLRRSGYAFTPLFCVAEARVESRLPRVLRALLTAETPRIADRRSVSHAYLDGAEALRPDLAV
jgi:chorismate mutase